MSDTPMTRVICGQCSVEFAMTDTFYELRKKDGSGWSCPNGCRRTFSVKEEHPQDDAEPLKVKIKELETKNAELETKNRELKCELLKTDNGNPLFKKWFGGGK